MLFSQFESASCKKGNHMQIAGSSAIVVGGAGGLGEATVRRLHGAGAKVVVADLADVAPRGVRKVVLAPTGFLSDHMEVLYDLDVEARESAERLGLSLARAATVGTHPAFVSGLADPIVERTTAGAGRAALG